MTKEERDGESGRKIKKKPRLSLEVKNEITNPDVFFFMPRFMTFGEWY